MDKVTDGLKHDGGKPRLALVPPEAIEAIGIVMTHGAKKYGEASYKNVAPERHRDAMMRHICKWLKDPHGLDEDSGLPHLWHIITNAAFLCELDISDDETEHSDKEAVSSNLRDLFQTEDENEYFIPGTRFHVMIPSDISRDKKNELLDAYGRLYTKLAKGHSDIPEEPTDES